MNKGQMTLFTVVFFVIALLAFFKLYPIVDDAINDMIAESDNQTVNWIALLVPAFMLIGGIIGFIYYVMPSRSPPMMGYGRY